MPLRVKKGGKTSQPMSGEVIEPGQEDEGGFNVRTSTGLVVNTAEFRTFGKLRLSAVQIAGILGIDRQAVLNMLRRSDLGGAYQKGMAQVSVALRTKALNMALSGNEKMLALMLQTLGDLPEVERESQMRNVTPPDASTTSRRTWGSELARLADQTAKKYADE